ncbi:hypothetical protein PMI05_04409 [Brevibacillus sp. BC25]|nr:hypothetical protein PMI05_04409 [Brevibacillus sp. BC25]
MLESVVLLDRLYRDGYYGYLKSLIWAYPQTLSRIFMKLVKVGLNKSASGANGVLVIV